MPDSLAVAVQAETTISARNDMSSLLLPVIDFDI